MKVREDHRRIAQALAVKLGKPNKVHRYWDDGEENFVDVCSWENQVAVGLTTYASLTVSDVDCGESDGRPFGTEFLLAAPSGFSAGANVLATAGLDVKKSRQGTFPGAVYRGVVELYDTSFSVKHLLATDPFLWVLPSSSFPERTVAFLQLVPITQRELEYSELKGLDALISRFEEARIDVVDFYRESAV